MVLPDDVKKTYPGVQDIVVDVFDKESTKDGEDRSINFQNTVSVMTDATLALRKFVAC